MDNTLDYDNGEMHQTGQIDTDPFLHAMFDALEEHLCVLDKEGVILAVNRAWREFAEANPPAPANYAVGENYLIICDQASGPDAAEAAPFAAGIRAVMRGEMAEFSLEYPCPSAENERWFIGRVTAFSIAGSQRLVVSHYNITDRKQAEKYLRQNYTYTRSLLAFSRKLELSNSLDDIIQAAQAEARQVVGYRSLWIYLFNSNVKDAQILIPGGELLKLANLSGGTVQDERLLNDIINIDEIVVIEDAQTNERTKQTFAARSGKRTIVFIPITLLDRRLGAVGAGTCDPEGVHPPTPIELEYLTALASHLAVAIVRVQLLTERERQTAALQRYADRMQGLYEIKQAILAAQSPTDIGQAALSRLRQEIACSGSSITLFDFERNEFSFFVFDTLGETNLRQGMRFPLSAEWHAQLETRQVWIVKDIQELTDPPQFARQMLSEGIRTYLSMPLVAHGDLIGALNLVAKQPDIFTTDDVKLIKEIAALLSVALQQSSLLEAEQQSRRQLRSLAHQLVTAQEEERRRLSRELHDEAGQSLTSLKMSLELLHSDLPPELASFGPRLAQIINLTDTTMEQIRLLAQNLRPPALDTLGLNPTLDGLCRTFAQHADLPVVYRGVDLPPLPETTKISLYRVLQEALTNIVRHAEASQVMVTLQTDYSIISLTVFDDGQGFQPVGKSSQAGGLGIVGMQERVSLLGGQLVIESSPGQGTWILAQIPYEESSQ